MVNQRRIKTSVCVLAAWAATSAFACGEYQPCEQAAGLPAIQSLSVLEASAVNSQSSDNQTDCTPFRLSVQQARNYLRKARRISQQAYLHQADASRCVAQGTLLFKGQKMQTQWQIGQQREAVLLRPRTHPLYLYCSRCTAAPFVK